MPSMAEAAKIRDVQQRHSYVFDNGLTSPDFFDVEKRMESEEFRLLAERVDPQWDILEVGCFTGLNLIGLATSGHIGNLVGVDFVLGAVTWLLERARFFRNITAHCDTFPGMRRRSDVLHNAVICFDVLEHQQNVGKFLDGVAAELSPGGKVFVLVPVDKNFYDCGHVAFYPDEECLSNVLGYHFEVESVRRLETCAKMFSVCTRRE